MKFKELERISSEILTCEYIVGEVEGGKYVYIWAENEDIEDEIPEELLADPECFAGAMIGTKEEIAEHIEDCVGSFRWAGDEAQQEAANEVVETLLEALN